MSNTQDNQPAAPEPTQPKQADQHAAGEILPSTEEGPKGRWYCIRCDCLNSASSAHCWRCACPRAPQPVAQSTDEPNDEDGPWADGWEHRKSVQQPANICPECFTDPCVCDQDGPQPDQPSEPASEGVKCPKCEQDRYVIKSTDHTKGSHACRRCWVYFTPTPASESAREAKSPTCDSCHWTNVNCLNVGETNGPSYWICHSCIAREHAALSAKEREVAELREQKQQYAEAHVRVVKALEECQKERGQLRAELAAANERKKSLENQIAEEHEHFNVVINGLRAQVAAERAKREAAERELTEAGWTHEEGAPRWKPPVNKRAGELWERLFSAEEQLAAVTRERDALLQRSHKDFPSV